MDRKQWGGGVITSKINEGPIFPMEIKNVAFGVYCFPLLGPLLLTSSLETLMGLQ